MGYVVENLMIDQKQSMQILGDLKERKDMV